MARQHPTQSNQSVQPAPVENPQDGTAVQTISNAPIESMPEAPGTTTAAVQAANMPAQVIGVSKGAQEQANSTTEVTTKYYRVVGDKDKPINSNGFRTLMRVGKELTDAQFDIRQLRQQGVKLQQFDPASGDDVKEG